MALFSSLSRRIRFFVLAIVLSLAAVMLPAASTVSASGFSASYVTGPSGSGSFGAATTSNLPNQNITVLPNGNLVITDTGFDDGAVLNVGAVHVYDGVTLERLSTLKGSTANDAVGSAVYTLNGSSNFVVASESWDRVTPQALTNSGAVTWMNGTTGLPANETVNDTKTFVVSASNSLIGGFNSDFVGGSGVIALANGNYVVNSNRVNLVIGGVSKTDVGAVTWGDGAAGVVGAVSTTNSLTGASDYDFVGYRNVMAGAQGVVALANGNYVVTSSGWDNASPAVTDAGAVTWVNGSNGQVFGASGPGAIVASSNSLIGSTASDFVGNSAPTPGTGSTQATINTVVAIPNGNYIVRSLLWDGNAANVGAVTWVNGSNGQPLGESSPAVSVSASNSLIGSTANDQVGSDGIVTLINGNYVVRSSNWDLTTPSAVSNVGAVTWGNGTSGIAGLVSENNSLIGSSVDDFTGLSGVYPLTNGNYVVVSKNWDSGAGSADVGAVTWVNGTNGYARGESDTGAVIASTNSLIGTTSGDVVGENGVTALTNGNYVVRSSKWDLTTPSIVSNVGAVTWGDGTTGIVGEVSTANSLHGSTASDEVGSTTEGGVTALTNGNYVVRSPLWDLTTPTTVSNVGAVTWGDGATGIVGPVSTANSLHGSTANDGVGSTLPNSVTALTNGNYVVRSPLWDLTTPTTVSNVGAVTWGDGTTGIVGPVSTANSLHGSTANDEVANTGVYAMGNGNYVVFSRLWDFDGVSNVGAVTWGNGTLGIVGAVSTANSLHGSTASDEVGHWNSAAAYSPIPSGTWQYQIVLRSPQWDDADVSPLTTNAGAITIFDTSTDGPRTSGPVSSSNSVIGSVASQSLGTTAPIRFDSVHNRVYVHANNTNNTVTVISAATPAPPDPQTPDPQTPDVQSPNNASPITGDSSTTNAATSDLQKSQSSKNATSVRQTLPETGISHPVRLAVMSVFALFAGLLLVNSQYHFKRRRVHE